MSLSPTPGAADELRGAGLRVTAARVALLETVRHGDHLGIEAITLGVRDRVGHNFAGYKERTFLRRV